MKKIGFKNLNSVAICVISLLAFFLYLFPIRIGFHWWDEAVYLQHAEIIAGLHWNNFNEFDFRPPLLPFLLAIFFKIYHSVILAHLLIAFLSTLGIFLTFKLSYSLFKDIRTSFLSALIFILNPLQLFLAHTIMVDPLLPIFWCATILTLILSFEKNNAKYFILCGFLTACSILLKFTSILLLPILLLISFLFNWKNFKFFLSRNFLLLFLSFFLTILPYLLANQILFGSPIYPFLQARQIIEWSPPSDPFLYFKEFHELFPMEFSLGILCFLIFIILRKKIKKEEIVLIICIIIPFVSANFIAHKEIRYLTLLIPFLSITTAKGFTTLFEELKDKKLLLKFYYIGLITIFLVALSTIYQLYTSSWLLKFQLIINNSDPAYEASLWIRDNTPSDVLVYSNFNYPVIAYYSLRRVQILPQASSFQDRLQEVMKENGIFFYDSRVPADKDPKLEFVLSDPRFKVLKEFESGDVKVIIFNYTIE